MDGVGDSASPQQTLLSINFCHLQSQGNGVHLGPRLPSVASSWGIAAWLELVAMSVKPMGEAQTVEEKVGLLRKVTPVHSGPLRRRTRFFKALHYFEIRSSVLLLYKSRKPTSNPGFLESLFSKTPEGDTIDSEIVQAASSRGQWDAAFDMSGATVTLLSADEKGGHFPFRITFEGIFVLSVSVIDACDKDSPQRSLCLTAPSAESRCVLFASLLIMWRNFGSQLVSSQFNMSLLM